MKPTTDENVRTLALSSAYSAAGARFLAAAALAGVTIATAAPIASAKPVGLPDATTAPAFLRTVQPAGFVAAGRPSGFDCKGSTYFSDVSAYTWHGNALGSQTWDAKGLRYVWRDRHGRAVTFDGWAFRNHTHSPVIVAGFCS